MRTCEHIKPNGEFCGSPALRGRAYCYFHLTMAGRRLRLEKDINKNKFRPLVLPALEDANAIQIAVMQVMEALIHGHISEKVAGLLLYGLQIASSNLAQGANFKQDKSATVCGSYESFEQDYELAEDDCDLKVAEEEGEESVSPTGLETTIDDASEMVAAEERRVRKDAMSQRLMIRIAPQSDWLKFPKEPKAVVA